MGFDAVVVGLVLVGVVGGVAVVLLLLRSTAAGVVSGLLGRAHGAVAVRAAVHLALGGLPGGGPRDCACEGGLLRCCGMAEIFGDSIGIELVVAVSRGEQLFDEITARNVGR